MSITKYLGIDNQVRMGNIWDIKGNLILKKDGSVFAMYRIPSKIINSVDFEAKEALKELEYVALDGLVSYGDCAIRRVPVNQELYDMFKKLSLDIDWESSVADLAEDFLQSQLAYLEESMVEVYEQLYFLIVPLKSIHVSVDLKSVLYEGYRSVRNTALSVVGLDEAVPENWNEKYKVQLEVLENTLHCLDAKPLSTDETYFINRHQYLRGMKYDKNFEIEFVQASIENLDEVNIEFENVNIMKLSNLNEERYLAFIPVEKLPQNMSYLHLEEEIQNIGFPVESDYLFNFSNLKNSTRFLTVRNVQGYG